MVARLIDEVIFFLKMFRIFPIETCSLTLHM